MTAPEIVGEFQALPSGITVTPGGRIFLCFPRWFEAVSTTVAELVDGRLVPYPSEEHNRVDWSDPVHHLFSVQSVVATSDEALWVLDTGRPYFIPNIYGGPKLLRIDLHDGSLRRIYTIPASVTHLGSYVNDVRFAFKIGAEGTAFITDSATFSPSALIVIDLATGRKMRRLDGDRSVRIDATVRPVIENEELRLRLPLGVSFPYADGADGIALAPDGSTLYYCPLTSRRLYALDPRALADPTIPDAVLATMVHDRGPKPVSDGLECDRAGTLYATDLENNRIVRWDGHAWETHVTDPRMLWTDTLCAAENGQLYFTCNQIHRAWPFHAGHDHRVPPYYLFRTPL